MKFRVSLAAAAAALVLCGTASAQLRAPRDNAAPAVAPRPAAAASAQAAAPEAAKANEDKEAAGKLAAGGWLVLLDRRDWGSAWENSSAVFRGAVPLAKWMDGIPKVRDELGALAERTPAESAYKTKLEGRPDGEYVTVIFVSKFANKEVQEVVTTVREADGKWRVTGYSTR
jgi:hypothetical protein